MHDEPLPGAGTALDPTAGPFPGPSRRPWAAVAMTGWVVGLFSIMGLALTAAAADSAATAAAASWVAVCWAGGTVVGCAALFAGTRARWLRAAFAGPGRGILGVAVAMFAAMLLGSLTRVTSTHRILGGDDASELDFGSADPAALLAAQQVGAWATWILLIGVPVAVVSGSFLARSRERRHAA